ncbi:unnamed protein product [Lampetra planeri]
MGQVPLSSHASLPRVAARGHTRAALALPKAPAGPCWSEGRVVTALMTPREERGGGVEDAWSQGLWCHAGGEDRECEEALQCHRARDDCSF